LGEDLRRFQEGKPIRARPVGRLEKAAKWVKRNPALAGSLTGGVLSGLTVETLHSAAQPEVLRQDASLPQGILIR
jgi:eukaryotic-like serine/threonine-protein kinase